MENEAIVDGSSRTEVRSIEPNLLQEPPKTSARKGDQATNHPVASSETSTSQYVENLGEQVEATGHKVSLLSSVEAKQTSNDSELAYRLESLSSNLAAVPLPNVSDPAFNVLTYATEALRHADKETVNSRQASFAFKELKVTGSASTANVKSTVASVLMAPLALAKRFSGREAPEKEILNNFDGITKSGELLLVLGRPGSGCSTLLRTIAGELGGLKISPTSEMNYNGLRHGPLIEHGLI